MQTKTFTAARFGMDEMVEEDTYFDGFTAGDHWNGWACPFFPKASVDTMIVWFDNNFGGWPVGRYDADKDTYYFDPKDGFDGEEEYPGQDIPNVGHVYPIGAWGWCWMSEEEANA